MTAQALRFKLVNAAKPSDSIALPLSSRTVLHLSNQRSARSFASLCFGFDASTQITDLPHREPPTTRATLRLFLPSLGSVRFHGGAPGVHILRTLPDTDFLANGIWKWDAIHAGALFHE
jgi:hypothetical protein